MIEILRYCLSTVPFMIPFLVLAFLLFKVNLKPVNRAYQVLMPFFSLLFVIVIALIQVSFFDTIAQHFFIAITLAMLIYVVYKVIIIRILKSACRNGGGFVEMMQHSFYIRDDKDQVIYLRTDRTRSRGYMKVLYVATVLIMTVMTLVSSCFYSEELLYLPVVPIYAVIMVGELAFMLGGVTKEEATGEEAGENDDGQQIGSYAMMRDVLRKLFADKLSAEDTVSNHEMGPFKTNEEVIRSLEEHSSTAVEAYGHFMENRSLAGEELDHNYVRAGKELLTGNSILFNNPFYYDLIPYVFYPLNRQLLTHHKVLIVLGRVEIENEIMSWCEEGLMEVNHTQDLWRIGVMDDVEQDLEVGILTREMVQDLKMHEVNAQFLSEVGMMILIEPSRLLTTAQIGLNSLIHYCSTETHKPIFCSVDKNCDGLLDALSHVLMVSLTEVSAMSHHEVQSSYMCWDGDGDHLQHRMLPNISRYLGFGTELSIAAVRNQIPQTFWYGGDGFPVLDIRWIAGQYYYDLLEYAAMPASQEMLDECFRVSANLWDTRKSSRLYITVEDDANNLFELKRDFSTRATEEGFINVISQDYLLKDYMTENEKIFSVDPKAIPYIVADYAHTARNVALRLCLRMSIGLVWESEIIRELLLIDASIDEPIKSLWMEICAANSSVDAERGDVISFSEHGNVRTFTQDIMVCKRKYNQQADRMENAYYINDADFVRLYVRLLQNAEYIAEDEQGNKQYLGSEILGQIYQGHLPSQYFTIAGKYYEMLYVASDNRIVLRRAADHITGRVKYRQVREYKLSHLTLDSRMGSSRVCDGLSVKTMYADIHVKTPAYWVMDRYQDFATAKCIEINGVPDREYYNKRVIRIGFEGKGQTITPEICRTLTVLMNEVFVTLFAENQCFIQALMPLANGVPLTYTLCGGENENGEQESLGENVIYIVEDSQLDIGLLESVQRNLDRIFAIICDYLDWHSTQIEISMNPPQEDEPKDVEVPKPMEASAERKLIRRLIDRIKNLFRQNEGNQEEGQEQETEQELDGGKALNEPEETEESEETKESENLKEAKDPEETVNLMMNIASGESEGDAQDEVEYEPDKALKVSDKMSKPVRKPYHERYYLLYGGTNKPEGIAVSDTLSFLRDRGYGNSELKQAREGQNLAEAIENGVDFNKGGHYCDFCGAPLSGSEYDLLADGRERCTMCSRTAIRSEDEFRKVYHSVVSGFKRYYGITINAPIKVEMVNAKRLHRALGKTFVPTGNADGRVLGVAISSGGGYRILLENGAPRLASTMTIAHELTHIWQYLNWDAKAIRNQYGKENERLIYEGMAKWTEIQYAYLIHETETAKREEMATRMREDEYGQGFLLYASRYPLSHEVTVKGETPFTNNPPL